MIHCVGGDVGMGNMFVCMEDASHGAEVLLSSWLTLDKQTPLANMTTMGQNMFPRWGN